MNTFNTTTTTEARLYIASLSDYNSGRLVGEWFDLSDYADADALLEAIGVMLAEATEEAGDGETREEWAAHDFEGFPRSLYCESGNLEAVYNYLGAVAELSDEEAEAFSDWCGNYGHDLGEATDLISDFREAYCGQYDTEEAYADELAEELGYFDAMKKAGMNASYFDTAAFARDLFIGGYWKSENGHVFRDC